ncbi:hypothetical protein [Franzmannia qiaohouensis]|uniref:Ribulose-1,5-bisphosphate carboxylase/oxygenase large subunit n=1 Tax=Franzmannia qiaohouensis TaxID=1329370 RepID=A0ABU1HF55_9GAMM|nr:hypothetical protein [Halomonas qiaohouensis]MDR5905678.1 hypothetical protein [Halomonas qiaohouensis]
MDKHYADTVRLLLSIAPEVYGNNIFAMKAMPGCGMNWRYG